MAALSQSPRGVHGVRIVCSQSCSVLRSCFSISSVRGQGLRRCQGSSERPFAARQMASRGAQGCFRSQRVRRTSRRSHGGAQAAWSARRGSTTAGDLTCRAGGASRDGRSESWARRGWEIRGASACQAGRGSTRESQGGATLRSVASLTPRRNSEDGQAAAEALPQPPPERQNRSTEPKMPKVVQTARPLYEITSPLSAPLAALPQALFPNVEVSTSTQLLLLTWARWGRNACRIKREETIKEMQHRRFPRSPPPKPVPLSPQPTPRAPPRGESPAESAAESPSRLAGAAAWRAGGQLGMGTTVHSREGGSPGRAAFDLADLREEQRDSMAEQGARMKLTRGLGGSAAQAHSRGTPGFGLDTPGFPGASGAASADASVASSGVASPVTKGGQMSPWLLEAEALCEEETEDEGSPGGGGWGFEPETDTLLMLEQEILGKRGTTQAPVKDQQEEDKPVLDEDELERVEVFEESPTKKNVQGASDRLQQLAEPRPPQEPSYSAFEYVVGEKVSYYSSSHGAWMPARIVERKSRTVYIIDKQMRGCLAKVRASELVSEAEERTNHVLRAFTVLETRQRPSSAMSSTRASSRPQSPAPAATKLPVSRGKIVRHDFSDDEDD
ncbi:unnamed protein product [Effrenium voratum]|nr:unnamed protein product [Effrenium voratum]